MDTNSENKTSQMTQELPSSNERFNLFFKAYIVAVIIVTGIVLLRLVLSGSPFIREELLLTILVTFLSAIVYLPMGLLAALGWVLQKGFGLDVNFISGFEGLPSADNTFQAVSQSLSYLLLLGVSITGFLTKKRRTFRILYYIFIGLLIIDIGGCMSLQF
jgi:hypothetical protein